MAYPIAIFLLGCIVSFVVVIGLARAAEFARRASARQLEIDPVPKNWDLTPPPAPEAPISPLTSSRAG